MRLDDVRDLIDELDGGRAADPALHALLGMNSAPSQLGLAVGAGAGPGDYRLVLLLERADGAALETASALGNAAGEDVTLLITGRFVLDSARSTQGRARPLRPGTSIGLTGRDDAGTLGAFVRLSSGAVALLSNAHVLSPHADGRPSGQVMQPGGFDGGSEPVAAVTVTAPVQPGVIKPIDAAAAALSPGVIHDTALCLVDRPFVSVGRAAIGMRVAKVGRTTGLTRGEVVGIDGRVWMDYPAGRVRLRDLVLTRGDEPFSHAGDSGAVLFAEDSLMACALHVGRNVPEVEPDSVYAVAHQMEDVLDRLDATLVS